MFGAEKLASTKRTFLLKLLTKEEAVSNANVVLPTPPLMDTNARMLVIILSPEISSYLGYIRVLLTIKVLCRIHDRKDDYFV